MKEHGLLTGYATELHLALHFDVEQLVEPAGFGEFEHFLDGDAGELREPHDLELVRPHPLGRERWCRVAGCPRGRGLGLEAADEGVDELGEAERVI